MTPVHNALRKLSDAKAIQDELLDPIEDAERIGAEALEGRAKRLPYSAGEGVV